LSLIEQIQERSTGDVHRHAGRGDDITTVDKPALIGEGINLVLAKYRRPAVAW
jgi:hypothetical protein